MFFPRDSVGLKLSQLVWLISGFSRQLVLSESSWLKVAFYESNSQNSLLFTLGREGPSGSGQLQGLKLFRVIYF